MYSFLVFLQNNEIIKKINHSARVACKVRKTQYAQFHKPSLLESSYFWNSLCELCMN